jgi:hypothetical protein
MLPFLWATSSFSKSHNVYPKVAKIGEKLPNLVILTSTVFLLLNFFMVVS